MECGSSVHPPDQLLHEGDTVTSLGINWLIREIPGHSPGHVVMISQSQLTPSIVLGATCCSREASAVQIFRVAVLSNWRLAFAANCTPFPMETVVYPGHGEPTTIGNEKRYNPFVSVKVMRSLRYRKTTHRAEFAQWLEIRWQMIRIMGEQVASCNCLNDAWPLRLAA